MYIKFEKNRICGEISFHKQDIQVLVVWGLMCLKNLQKINLLNFAWFDILLYSIYKRNKMCHFVDNQISWGINDNFFSWQFYKLLIWSQNFIETWTWVWIDLSCANFKTNKIFFTTMATKMAILKQQNS